MLYQSHGMNFQTLSLKARSTVRNIAASAKVHLRNTPAAINDVMSCTVQCFVPCSLRDVAAAPQAAHSQQGGIQYTDPEAVRAVPAHHPFPTKPTIMVRKFGIPAQLRIGSSDSSGTYRRPRECALCAVSCDGGSSA